MLESNPHQIRPLVVGASPDAFNNNSHLRRYVVEGFQNILGPASAREIGLENAINVIEEWGPTLIIMFGSCMAEQSNYL